MDKQLVFAWGNIFAIVVTIGINILANALPLNGKNTGDISDQFKVFFVPAGYVFAIWGLIYLGWIAFGIHQILPDQIHNPRLARIEYWFIIACIANCAWLFLHYERFPLTLIAMFTLLASLIIIYLRLNIGPETPNSIERWVVDVPFSLYLGWITVATIANVTSVLYNANWSGWGIAPEFWAVIMLAVAGVVGLVMAITRHDITFLLVLLWSFVGISVKHAGVPSVSIAAWSASGLVVVGIIISLFRILRP